ncbi:MAG: hypothetical protein HFG56_07185 [Lachnospiraceae bacterium]|nr:hypothetical protein [Lachnospiraceae bacterium]
MKLRVNIKSVSKRRKAVEETFCEIAKRPKTVRELIQEVVDSQVAEYNQQIERSQSSSGQCPEVLACLTKEEIEDQAESGKIGFGISYGEKMADSVAARENAWQCFEDGIYRIFMDGQPLERLEEAIVVTEDTIFTFVRLTMLAGRMW